MRGETWVPWLCACLLGLAGCGDSGPETYSVSGTVSFNGEPLSEGQIVFSPSDGAIAPDAGKIIEGRFEFRSKPGKKRVEIHADREVGEVDPVMNARRREPYIPARYNAQSVLEAEVKPSGGNQFAFELRGEATR